MRQFSSLTAALVAASALAAPVQAAEPPGWPAFRAMFQEMVETDTSYASGDCTVAVNKVAALSQQKLGNLASGMNLPAGFKLPF